jgi:hypothetical protein
VSGRRTARGRSCQRRCRDVVSVGSQTGGIGDSLAWVSDPARRGRGRIASRESKLPSDRDWERSALLEPAPSPRYPELISDGGGLPFPPGALAGPRVPLDPNDPAVSGLLAHLTARAAPKRASRLPWKRDAAPPPPPPPPSLEGWRLLARTDGEALFARGLPPKMLTMAFRQDARRRTWTCHGSSAARPLRAARDGIRASSWRPDPSHDVRPEDTTLRVLVSEQAYASGQRATGRVLAPDMYVDDNELVLTIFVTPLPGFQNGTRNPETPVRIALPHPLGPRRLLDGALMHFSTTAPAPPDAGDSG